MPDVRTPGETMVRDGLADLRAARETEAALLVSIAAARLRQLGSDLPPPFADPTRSASTSS